MMSLEREITPAKFNKDANFLKAVFKSAYGKGYYLDHATNYARTLLNN